MKDARPIHRPIQLPTQGQERFWGRVQKGEDCWEWTGSLSRKGYGYFSFKGVSYLAHRVSYTLTHGDPAGLDVDHLCRNRRCVNPAHLEAVPHRENVRRSNGWASKIHNTHCPNGHEYTSENTDMSRGHRRCRTCARVNELKGRAKYRASERGKAKQKREGAKRREVTRRRFEEQFPGVEATPANVARLVSPTTKLTRGQVLMIRERHAAGGVTMAALAREYGIDPETVRSIIRRITWRDV